MVYRLLIHIIKKQRKHLKGIVEAAGGSFKKMGPNSVA